MTENRSEHESAPARICLFRVAEAAELLRVTPGALRAWIREKRIPAIRLGKLVMISAETLERVSKEGL